jgi:hypothetical protein
VNYSNQVKMNCLKSKMIANVNLEPFDIKVGFREIEFFNKIN